MDAHAVLNVLMALVAAASPFVLSKVSLKGPQMAFVAFGTAGVLAAVSMVLGGDVNGIGGVFTDPGKVLPYVAEFVALQQGVYAFLKDRALL